MIKDFVNRLCMAFGMIFKQVVKHFDPMNHGAMRSPLEMIMRFESIFRTQINVALQKAQVFGVKL